MVKGVKKLLAQRALKEVNWRFEVTRNVNAEEGVTLLRSLRQGS